METTKTPEDIIEINIKSSVLIPTLFDTAVFVYFSQEDGPNLLSHMINTMFGSKINALMIPQDTHPTITNYENLYEYLCRRSKYVLIGGDNSCTIPSIQSSLKKINNPSDLYVIWIGAHANIINVNNCKRTFKKSTSSTSSTPQLITQLITTLRQAISKPLGGIVGFEPSLFEAEPKLLITNLLYFGMRNVNDCEETNLSKNNIFNTSETNEMFDKLERIINSNNNAKFHISFDVSALDPQYMECVNNITPFGIKPEQVSEIISFVFNEIVAFDIVGFNPSLGNTEQRILATQSIQTVVQNIVNNVVAKVKIVD